MFLYLFQLEQGTVCVFWCFLTCLTCCSLGWHSMSAPTMLARNFVTHMTKPVIWLARIIWDVESQEICPKIPDHPFHGHFVSVNGGMGMRLTNWHVQSDHFSFDRALGCFRLTHCVTLVNKTGTVLYRSVPPWQMWYPFTWNCYSAMKGTKLFQNSYRTVLSSSVACYKCPSYPHLARRGLWF